VREDERDLPAWILGTLAPHLQQALGSRTRRRILRALHYTSDAQTIADLFRVVPAESLSALGYHVGVLEKAACVSQDAEVARSGGLVRTYTSNVSDNLVVMDALRATQREDDWLGT